MNKELKIDRGMFRGDQDDLDALKMAIERLTTVSQEQFEQIKDEKWYVRVFDMVTFSKKNEKRLAEQVNTVAQAQQILLELLINLSSDSKDVAILVANSADDIRKLSEQNIYLLSKIKHLENVALGIKNDMNVDTLTEFEKGVLCACLYKITELNGNASEEQKKFANVVISYLGVDIQMENPTAALANMKNEQKKKILACCMEYMFLRSCAFDSLDVYEDFIEEFDFGNKTIKELKNQIERMYCLRGDEGFYSKYVASNYEGVDEIFYLQFDDEALEEIYEEEKNIFSDEDWSYLYELMKKYEIIRDGEGYRELVVRNELGISPGAYLGKFGDKSIYFTTQAMYVHLFSDEGVQLLCSQFENLEAAQKVRVHMPDEHILSNKWMKFEYSALDLEQILYKYKGTRGENQVELMIPNISGDCFKFIGSQEEADKLTALLHELGSAKTTEYDQYMPTWCAANVEYAQILVDFLKLRQHSVVAALVKASTMVFSEDEEDHLFQEFCKHGLSQYVVTIEDLKDEILQWKDTLDAHVENLYMAILVKDLIEVLQMATGEPGAMLKVEKQFFDWLLQEAAIDDGQFLDMVRLPYLLLINIDKVIDYNIVVAIEKYAYEQMYIPFDILDNEKGGLWSALHRVTEEYSAHFFMTDNNKRLVNGCIRSSMGIECCNICMNIYLFVLMGWSVEPSVMEWDDVRLFIRKCGLDVKVKNIIEESLTELFNDKDWDLLTKEYLEYDRRSVGDKMEGVETLFDKLLDNDISYLS